MLWIARAVSLTFRAAGACSSTSLTCCPTLAIRVAQVFLGAERIGIGRRAGAGRVRHCTASPALSSILIARAALLPVTTGQRESRTGEQDRFSHI